MDIEELKKLAGEAGFVIDPETGLILDTAGLYSVHGSVVALVEKVRCAKIESLQRELAAIPKNCVHIQLDKNGHRIVGIRCKDDAQLADLQELGQRLVRGH